MDQNILELFNVMVTENSTPAFNTDYVSTGVVLDFSPTQAQVAALQKKFAKLNVTTLFTKNERLTSTVDELLAKQFLHYFEVYGLHQPGLFDIEATTGQIVTMNFVHGVSAVELSELVRTLIYSNAPIKDTVAIVEIIKRMSIKYDINKVANNEVRICLFDVHTDVFTDGDDAVRYMCYMASSVPMLIKSIEVIEAVRGITIPVNFFKHHILPLAQVFNRHKRIIIAAKNSSTKSVINKISRLSKTAHKPMREAVNKRFITEALANDAYDFSVLDNISTRDKFKYLNLLMHKLSQSNVDLFNIRNGKVFIKDNRPIYDIDNVNRVLSAVIDNLRSSINITGNVLLDKNVDYGLPISRKQTIGQLPYGTTVSIDAASISAGMYWENEWGASDLDLSTVNENGERTGWGCVNGYSNDSNDSIVYSGDLTDASNGATEFMTSTTAKYGLLVNIYSGEPGAEMELVVGAGGDDNWIDKPVIRERYTLNSNSNIVGFVNKTKFVVYNGRLSNHTVSGQTGTELLVTRALGGFWTIQTLFDKLDIPYDTIEDKSKTYNHNLSYASISYDKIEDMLL